MLKRGGRPKFFRPESLLGELIGETIEVVRSKDRRLIGLRGKIVFETKDAFLIDAGDKTIWLYKRGSEFLFPSLGLRVRGEVLYIDPALRTKKLRLRRR